MSGLFSTPEAPPTPAPKPPAPMPDPDSAGVREARRRAQLDIMGRAGRSSTILTTPERRGSSDYTATRLGSSA